MKVRSRTASTARYRIILREHAMSSYCQEHRITRAELARRIGVSENTGFRIDSGEVDPSPRFMAGLAMVTGRSFDDLFQIVEEHA